MTDISTTPRGLNIPNLITVARIAAVPALVLCLFFLEEPTGRIAAFALFAAASLSDWLDGYLARAWQQHSAFGAMLDPIADKLLVGATLLMLVYDQTITGVSIFAAAIILCREILVSGLREYLAGLNVKVLVTQLAKYKTVVQMIALALLLIGPALAPTYPDITTAGISLLWAAALLTLWTGWDYLRAGLKHTS